MGPLAVHGREELLFLLQAGHTRPGMGQGLHQQHSAAAEPLGSSTSNGAGAAVQQEKGGSRNDEEKRCKLFEARSAILGVVSADRTA